MTLPSDATAATRLVLICADRPTHAAITQALAEAPDPYTLDVCDSEAAGLARVRAHASVDPDERESPPIDCVLLDAPLAGGDGLEVLAQLQAAQLPIILLTETGDEGLVARALRQGAGDYLRKSKIDAETLGSKIRVVRRLHEAVAARDSVLAVVSHDLRGPLNNIKLAMDLLQGDPPEAQRELAVASVHRAIARADRLISELLDVARLRGGAIELVREPIDPGALVATALADVQPAVEQHGLRVELVRDDELPPVLADRDRVLQVLDNLLRNAIKYGPRGGTVRVELHRRGDRVEFAVADQGPGLDDDAQAHVFDRFWRARERRRAAGSGLGLAIAKGLVHSHGGDIGVASKPGDGARFHFTIPTAR